MHCWPYQMDKKPKKKSASRRAFFFFWLLPVLRLTGTSSTNGSSSTIVYSVKMVDYWRGKNFSVNLKGRKKKHYREVSCPSQIGPPSMVGGVGGCFPCPISLEDLVSRLKDPVWSMVLTPMKQNWIWRLSLNRNNFLERKSNENSKFCILEISCKFIYRFTVRFEYF